MRPTSALMLLTLAVGNLVVNREQAFSNFMEMHPILSTYRVGNITLKIVELEVQRAKHR